MVKHGEFVVKEIEALYKLKKYRAMKKRYYDENWGGELLCLYIRLKEIYMKVSWYEYKYVLYKQWNIV